MRKETINFNIDTKLSKFLPKDDSDKKNVEQIGFISKKNQSLSVKTFKFRPNDIEKLKLIRESVNSIEDLHKTYNDSEIIRGILSLVAANLDAKKLLQYIQKVN